MIHNQLINYSKTFHSNAEKQNTFYSEAGNLNYKGVKMNPDIKLVLAFILSIISVTFGGYTCDGWVCSRESSNDSACKQKQNGYQYGFYYNHKNYCCDSSTGGNCIEF